MKGPRAALGVALAVGSGACTDPALPERLDQHQLTEPGDLLTPEGTLREPGWATTDLLVWDRGRVAHPDKLREWDFFTLMNDEVAVNVTIGNAVFLFGSVNVVDLQTGEVWSSMALGTEDELILSTALGDSSSLGSEVAMTAQGTDTVVSIAITDPFFSSPASGAFTVHRRAQTPFLSLATPFGDEPSRFFYEQKIPGLSAEGTLTIDDETWTFDAADTIAVMDWGRGEWPSSVTWEWAWGSGTVDGETFAFNLGSVHGDDRRGTENVLFFGDEVTKLGRVTWEHDEEDLMAPSPAR